MKFKDRDERIMVTEDIFREILEEMYTWEFGRIIDDKSNFENGIYSAIEKMIAVHLDTWEERL